MRSYRVAAWMHMLGPQSACIGPQPGCIGSQPGYETVVVAGSRCTGPARFLVTSRSHSGHFLVVSRSRRLGGCPRSAATSVWSCPDPARVPGRCNANAERVADAIIIACMARGAPKPEGATYTAAVRATMKKGSK